MRQSPCVPRDISSRCGDWLSISRIQDPLTGTSRGPATCRWLACAAIPSITGGLEPAPAPASRRSSRAHEELIEAELMAAEMQMLRHPSGPTNLGL